MFARSPADLVAWKAIVLIGQISPREAKLLKGEAAKARKEITRKLGGRGSLQVVTIPCKDADIPRLTRTYSAKKDTLVVFPVTTRTIRAMSSRNPRSDMMIQLDARKNREMMQYIRKSPSRGMMPIELDRTNWRKALKVGQASTPAPSPDGTMCCVAADRMAGQVGIGFTSNPYSTFRDPSTGSVTPGPTGPFFPNLPMAGISKQTDSDSDSGGGNSGTGGTTNTGKEDENGYSEDTWSFAIFGPVSAWISESEVMNGLGRMWNALTGQDGDGTDGFWERCGDFLKELGNFVYNILDRNGTWDSIFNDTMTTELPWNRSSKPDAIEGGGAHQDSVI